MIFIINLKTYAAVQGEKAAALARICKDISKKKNAALFLAPQPADIARVSSIIPTLSQHTDAAEGDRHTGFITPENIKANGAAGTLLNHSEHRIPFQTLKKTIATCKTFGLKTVVCAATLSEVKKIIPFRPFAIAYEVPELIATGIPVSKAKAGSVKTFAGMLKGTGIVPLCGAGISSGDDVRAALALGCKGVLAASAVTLSKNFRKTIEEMCSS